MIGSEVAVAGWARPVDAGWCPTPRDSAVGTDREGGRRSGAAGRVQTVAGAAEPVI